MALPGVQCIVPAAVDLSHGWLVLMFWCVLCDSETRSVSQDARQGARAAHGADSAGLYEAGYSGSSER